jgi:uncharacterized protein (TIGR01777 family)
MRVVVSGSTGLIGTALVERLRADGHDVARLVRGEPPPRGGPDIGWDPHAGRLDPAALSGADAVVNLAGAGIGDHRWSDAYKQQILESRTRSTNLLAQAIAARDDGPRIMLSASGVHVYGDRGDEELDESSAPADAGFLTSVVRAWEASTAAAEEAGARVVHLRSGVVLTAHGGALTKMLPVFRLGLGGRFGSGRQWMSWISLTDEVAAIVHLLTSELAGPVNLTAPGPVRNADFARALAGVLHRPAIVPVPAFGPRVLLGRELADALLFESQRVVRSALSADGFSFALPSVGPALRELLGRE